MQMKNGVNRGHGNKVNMRGPRLQHPKQQQYRQPQQALHGPQQYMPRIPTLSYEELIRATVRPPYGNSYHPPAGRYNGHGPMVYHPDDLEEQMILARLRAEAAVRMDRQARMQSASQQPMHEQVKPNFFSMLHVEQNQPKTTPPSGGSAMFSPPTGRSWASPNTPSSIASVPSMGSISSLSSMSGAAGDSPSAAELSDQLRRLVLGPNMKTAEESVGSQRGTVSLPATPLMSSEGTMGGNTSNTMGGAMANIGRSPGAWVSTGGGQLVTAWDIVQGRSAGGGGTGAGNAKPGSKKRDPTSPSSTSAAMAGTRRLRPNLSTVPEEPAHEGTSGAARPAERRRAGSVGKSAVAASWRKQRITDNQPGPLEDGEIREPSEAEGKRVRIRLPPVAAKAKV